mgnify:CR=1 FL=1
MWCEKECFGEPEILNSITSLAIALAGVFGIRNVGFSVAWVALVVTGFGSFAFHWTETEMTRIVDEGGIVIYGAWWYFNHSRISKACSLFLWTFIIHQTIWNNDGRACILQMSTCVIGGFLGKKDNPLSAKAYLSFYIALGCWLLDLFACVCSFPVMHSAWHLAIAVAAYQGTSDILLHDEEDLFYV